MLEQFKTENFISFLIVLWTLGNQNTLISKTYLTEQQKKLPFSCAFLNKKEFAITIFVCMFQQKHLKCLDDFFFLITILEVGLITCFRERCYFTEIALVLSTVAS